MPRGSCWPPLRQTGEDNLVVSASHGSAPANRIWNITILRSPKQQIWLRTALCGGWCRRMALRNRELHARNDDDDDTYLVASLQILCLSVAIYEMHLFNAFYVVCCLSLLTTWLALSSHSQVFHRGADIDVPVVYQCIEQWRSAHLLFSRCCQTPQLWALHLIRRMRRPALIRGHPRLMIQHKLCVESLWLVMLYVAKTLRCVDVGVQ